MPVCVAPSMRVLALGPSMVSDFIRRLPPSVSMNAPNSAADPSFSRIFALKLGRDLELLAPPPAVHDHEDDPGDEREEAQTLTTIGMNASNTCSAITGLL